MLALNFEERRAFDEGERGLLDALVKLFGQSLERAKLYEDARRREWAASLVARLSESLERDERPGALPASRVAARGRARGLCGRRPP